MALEALECVNIRNLTAQCITLSPGLNCFYGNNGAGKSAILESIYLLGTGKSFRASQFATIMAHGEKTCQIGGRLAPEPGGAPYTIKCIKNAHAKPRYVINDEQAVSVAALAQILPVQILSLEGYQLLADPPEERRRWLDWLMFHVEPSFYECWKTYHRLLKQRNAALRGTGSQADLPQWTALLGLAGQQLHDIRQAAVARCFPVFQEVLAVLPGVTALNLSYEGGWDEQVSLEAALFASHERDMFLGYTHAGPHRADLKIKINEKPAAHVLSTGQQKTFVTGLQLAQVSWMIEQTGKRPTLLIDDLPSELDRNARAVLGERLSGLQAQICLTSVDKNAFNELNLPGEIGKMFHVEHGVVL